MTNPNQPPVVEESERLYEGAVISLRHDRIRLPSGRSTTRDVVEHRGAVSIVAVTADGHLLMVRQFRYPVERPLLECPAGVLEPGEPPIETARRELLEETGYRAASLREIKRFYSSAGYSTEQITLVFAEGCELSDEEAAADEDEGIELEQWPLDQIDTLIRDHVEAASTLIGLLWLKTTLDS